MKIGDLIKVVPSKDVRGYAPSCVRRHFNSNNVGMIVDIKLMGGNKYWITLIGEQKYMIPEWNVRLLNDAANR